MLADIRVLLSRILGGLIASLAVFIEGKWDLPIPAETQEAATVLIAFVVYAAAHRLFSRFFNPADVATTKASLRSGQGEVNAS